MNKKSNYTKLYPILKARTREMRNNSTKGEIKFWCELLRKGKSGFQFYRQKIIGKYIVDFYCAKLKLVIEIDGTVHNHQKSYDERREEFLESCGLKVVHYEDLMVLNNFHLVEKDFWSMLKRSCERVRVLNPPVIRLCRMTVPLLTKGDFFTYLST